MTVFETNNLTMADSIYEIGITTLFVDVEQVFQNCVASLSTEVYL